jgi:hypothetical protein
LLVVSALALAGYVVVNVFAESSAVTLGDAITWLELKLLAGSWPWN